MPKKAPNLFCIITSKNLVVKNDADGFNYRLGLKTGSGVYSHDAYVYVSKDVFDSVDVDSKYVLRLTSVEVIHGT